MRIFVIQFLILLSSIYGNAQNLNHFPTDKPNIILIYADDLGKGLLSHEGQQIINTTLKILTLASTDKCSGH